MFRYIPSEELKGWGYDMSMPENQRLLEMCERVDRLFDAIDVAFAGVESPKVTLSVAREADLRWSGQGSGLSIEELRGLDPEVAWTDVSREKVEKYQEYFNFGDDESGRFYYPAFMRWFLLQFPSCGYVAICDAARRESCVELLDKGQMLCVREFAQLCDDYQVGV